jgi:hypothetical protein
MNFKRRALRKENPATSPDVVRPVRVIYARVLRVEAQKTQKHRCDPGCKKSDHCYYHDFNIGTDVQAIGMSDGSVLLTGKKPIWDMFD